MAVQNSTDCTVYFEFVRYIDLSSVIEIVWVSVDLHVIPRHSVELLSRFKNKKRFHLRLHSKISENRTLCHHHPSVVRTVAMMHWTPRMGSNTRRKSKHQEKEMWCFRLCVSFTVVRVGEMLELFLSTRRTFWKCWTNDSRVSINSRWQHPSKMPGHSRQKRCKPLSAVLQQQKTSDDCRCTPGLFFELPRSHANLPVVVLLNWNTPQRLRNTTTKTL